MNAIALPAWFFENAEATRRARDRLKCKLVGSCAGKKPRTIDMVLVVYRPTGSSIVVTIAESLTPEQFREDLVMLSRPTIALALQTESFALSDKERAATNPTARKRLHHDAWLLYNMAKMIESGAPVTSEQFLIEKGMTR